LGYGFLEKPFENKDILELVKKYPKGSKIMIVDDEYGTREAIVFLLKRYEYSTILCSSGEEALKEFRVYGKEIPLVITDVEMEGMDGFELAEKLKQYEKMFADETPE
jgi:CheY-like chemotaxis protein